MDYSHSAVGSIDMLATFACRSESVYPKVFWVDFNVYLQNIPN